MSVAFVQSPHAPPLHVACAQLLAEGERALLQDRVPAARRMGDQATTVAGRTGNRVLLGRCLSLQGAVAAAGGSTDQARGLLEAALRMLGRGKDPDALALAYLRRADLEMTQGDALLAAAALLDGQQWIGPTAPAALRAHSLALTRRIRRRL